MIDNHHTQTRGDEMKLIDLIVKEVKREDIHPKGNFFAQDRTRILCAHSIIPLYNGSVWCDVSMGSDEDNSYIHGSAITINLLADDQKTSIISRKELMDAYDTAEKSAEPEKLVDDDSFGQSERYNRGNIECIDIIREMVSDKSGEESFCVGNITKYLYRYKSKGGLKDVIKTRNYLNQMIKGMENE